MESLEVGVFVTGYRSTLGPNATKSKEERPAENKLEQVWRSHSRAPLQPEPRRFSNSKLLLFSMQPRNEAVDDE
jgi:hypothetical protein